MFNKVALKKKKKEKKNVSRVYSFEDNPKNPSLLWIMRINNPFLDFSKETKYPLSD